MTGCPFQSDYPLGKIGDSNVDLRLLGDWEYVDQTGDKGVLSVYSFSNHQYLILIQDDPDSHRSIYSAYPTEFENQIFLNYQDITDSLLNRKYGLASYVIQNDELIIKLVDDKTIPKTSVNSSEDLKEFLRPYLNDENTFQTMQPLSRKKPN